MANKQQRQQLYEWFETGDRPSQLQFEDFIDSVINQQDDDIWVDDEDLFNGQANPYQGFIGIGNQNPVTKLSLSGSMIVGAGWASERAIVPIANIPDDGMLIEGSVKIGTIGNVLNPNPDNYRLEIKNKESGLTDTAGSRPLRLDSNNHDMIVFSDTKPVSDPTVANLPYTLLDEGGKGFRFYSYVNTGDNRETVRITKDGFVGIQRQVPAAKLDIAAGSAKGLKIETTNDDAITLAGIGNSTPFTIEDEANRGFRFNTQGSESLRITPQGDVGIGEDSPQYKLHVDGDIALNEGGSVYGLHTNTPLKIHSGSNSTDGAYLELFPASNVLGSTKRGEMNFVAVGDSEDTGWYFKQQQYAGGALSTRVQIRNSGQVGVNISGTPTNYLDLDGNYQSSNTPIDTGLRLRAGAADRSILSSDANGNAKWMALGAFVSEGIVPMGVIVMWSGAPENLPLGWALCDGNNGPDLRGRFIVAYDDRTSDPNNGAWHIDYSAPHNTGGATEVKLTSAQSGVSEHEHDHDLEVGDGKAILRFGTWPQPDQARYNRDNDLVRRGGNGYSEKGTEGPDPLLKQDPHTHPISGTVSSVKGGDKDAEAAHENRPPFYVLAFIIKL